MIIPLRKYDLDAARQRVRAGISREHGFGYDYSSTHKIRTLKGASHAVLTLQVGLESALTCLPIGEGGTGTPAGAILSELRPDLPLVRAWMVLHGHPSYEVEEHILFDRPGQFKEYPVPNWKYGPHDAGPVIERYYATNPQHWDRARFESLVFEGACTAYGDETIDSDWTLRQIYPGSRISEYTSILANLLLLEAFGALDPAFTRQDALVGEWWLLQPVSPRLNHWEIASRLGLEWAGYLPQRHVDVAGRVVMACYARDEHSEDHRISLIEGSKWIAGWQKVTWSKDQPPLTDPAFDFDVALAGVTEDSYGPFRHSSELPPWGAR